MASFDKYVNYNDGAGVSSVIFGADKTVLEVELNEMQEINKYELRKMISKVIGDGITDLDKLVYENGSVKILDGCSIAINGMLVNCNGLSIATTNATVYLQIWEVTVGYSDTLNAQGNQQSLTTVTNWIKDSRSEVETTKRKVIKYTLATSQTAGISNLAVASVSNGIMTKLVKEINLSKLTSSVSDVKGFIGYSDGDIYGVEADWQNNKFTRLAGAVGKVGGANFDSVGAFNRRRCIITDDGVVLAYYGDSNYTETGATLNAILIGETTYPTGTSVQVMVEQNKFYYKMVPLGLEKIANGIGFKVRKARYYISNTYKDGFKIHPAFIRNGIELDKIYIGAYKACLYDVSASAHILDDAQVADFTATTGDKMCSIANTKPMSGLTQDLIRAKSRILAQNRGTGWQQLDFPISSMNEMLFVIEYAKMNAQEVLGNGVISITDNGTTNLSKITGGTSTLGNASGMESGTSGLVSISYRGQEDPFGNIWEFVDGINIEANNKNVAYWADHGFADNIGSSPYQTTGFTITKTSGYISAFGYNEDCDWTFLPAEASGDSSKPVGDYTWVNPSYAGWFITLLGGNWSHGSSCGLCFWALHNASSGRGRGIGSRLVYIPQVV